MEFNVTFTVTLWEMDFSNIIEFCHGSVVQLSNVIEYKKANVAEFNNSQVKKSIGFQ